MLRGALDESQLELGPTQIDGLVNAVFRVADDNGDGVISLAEFRATLESYPDLYERMTVSAVAWAAPLQGKKRVKVRKPPPLKRYAQITSSAVLFLVATRLGFSSASRAYSRGVTSRLVRIRL